LLKNNWKLICCLAFSGEAAFLRVNGQRGSLMRRWQSGGPGTGHSGARLCPHDQRFLRHADQQGLLAWRRGVGECEATFCPGEEPAMKGLADYLPGHRAEIPRLAEAFDPLACQSKPLI
jgi:hypothetical protein